MSNIFLEQYEADLRRRQEAVFSAGSFRSAPASTLPSTAPPYWHPDVRNDERVPYASFSTAQPTYSQAKSMPKGYFEQMAGFGLGISNLLIGHVFSHPWVILRRQCQVNNRSEYYHVLPITLLSPICNLLKNQGFACLSKGVFSTVIVDGLTVASETVFSNLFGLEREVNRYSSQDKFIGHLVLKALSFAVTTPFYAASYVETVISFNLSERPGVLDFIKEGFNRVSYGLTGHRDLRRIPVWWLIGPSVLYNLTHYIISGLTHSYIFSAVKRRILDKSNKHGKPRTVFDDFFPDLAAAFASHLFADGLLFPLETVLHRLFLQGNRGLIDNLDTGESVFSCSTRYEGFLDSISVIYRDEGLWGFYKGFGALMLQYGIHYAVLRILSIVFEQLENSLREDRMEGVAAGSSESTKFVLTD